MHHELCDKDPIESSGFVSSLQRLHSTGHENRVPKVFQEYGLQADVAVSYCDIGLKHRHPFVQLRDLVGAFNKSGKIMHLLAGNGPAELQSFWAKYAKQCPGHDVYQRHSSRLHECLPMMLHLDEGTSHKKKSIMVLSVQTVCGKGSKRSPGHNFLGSTYLSRLLFSVLLGRTYVKKRTVLYALFQAWQEDLTNSFDNGIPIDGVPGMRRLYPVILAVKGDWPAITKAGRLVRHFLRDAPGSDCPSGICHLCRAGQIGYPWNSFNDAAPWLFGDAPLPWTTPSPLSNIPQDKNNLAGFYAIDLFHVCHKGVVADHVASAIETRMNLGKGVEILKNICIFL